MNKKKKTLSKWSVEELEKICQDMKTEPIFLLLKQIQNNDTWNKIVWFLEWIPDNKQQYLIKKIGKVVKDRGVDIDVKRKLKEIALENKVRIVIPQ